MNVGSNEKVDISSQYVTKVRLAHDGEYSTDINRKQKECYTSLKSSSQHSKMNMLKRGRSKRTYAKMKGSPKYTDTINKRKDVKRKRLYESSVICFNIEKYSVDENIMFMLKSYDDNYYICRTRGKALRKNSVPCQVVANRINVVELPKLFQDIRRLKRLPVSRRVLFKKVTVVPKGKSLKIKGNICNIPVSEVDVNFNMLSRPADSNGLIIVMFKLEYKDHVIFKAVRPDVEIQFLEFLRSHNDLYSDIEINPPNIPVYPSRYPRFETF